jgi:hypothetical protein
MNDTKTDNDRGAIILRKKTRASFLCAQGSCVCLVLPHFGQRRMKPKGITDAAGLFRSKFPRILQFPLFYALQY